jgi:hypothetical protein
MYRKTLFQKGATSFNNDLCKKFTQIIYLLGDPHASFASPTRADPAIGCNAIRFFCGPA